MGSGRKRVTQTGSERRDGAEKVRWVHGDARALPRGLQVEAAVMAGHAFQCLLTDADVRMTLAAVRAALAPGGRLMFESRNPAVRPWRAWPPRRPAAAAANPPARRSAGRRRPAWV